MRLTRQIDKREYLPWIDSIFPSILTSNPNSNNSQSPIFYSTKNNFYKPISCISIEYQLSPPKLQQPIKKRSYQQNNLFPTHPSQYIYPISQHHSSHLQYLHCLYFEPADLRLHPHAVGPDEADHAEEVEPCGVVASQLADVESLPLDESGDVVPHCEVLMGVTGIPHFEAVVGLFEVVAALRIMESVFDEEVDEHNEGVRPNPIGLTALVPGLVGSEVFRCSVGDHLFPCGVVLCPGIAVGVSNMSGVMPNFVVVAFGVEDESADHFPHTIVVRFKILPAVDVAEVLRQRVAAAANNEIQDIGSTDYSDEATEGKLDICEEVQHIGGDHTRDEKEGGNECLTVMGVLFRAEVVEILCEL